jgi:hypothetical protein
MANCKNKQAATCKSSGKRDAVSSRICQIKQSGKNKINNVLGSNKKPQVFLIQASCESPFSYGPLESGFVEVDALCPVNWVCFTVDLFVLSFIKMDAHSPCNTVSISSSVYAMYYFAFCYYS